MGQFQKALILFSLSLLCVGNRAFAGERTVALKTAQKHDKQDDKMFDKKHNHHEHSHAHSHSDERGKRGKRGREGYHGRVGIPGVQGVQGHQGKQGNQGIPGVQGLPGAPGTTGTTAISTFISDTAFGQSPTTNGPASSQVIAQNNHIIFSDMISQSGAVTRSSPGVYTVTATGVYNVTFGALCTNVETAQPTFALRVNGVVIPESITELQFPDADYATLSLIINVASTPTTIEVVNFTQGTPSSTDIELLNTFGGQISSAFITIKKIN